VCSCLSEPACCRVLQCSPAAVPPHRGRERRLVSLPLPPNRTCGSPASGSPVGGSPRKGRMRVQGVQREHSMHLLNEHLHQHPCGPERRVNRGLASSLSPIRHSHWCCRHRSALHVSTFLRSLRSTPVTELHRYYGRSDSCLLRLFGTWSMNSGSFSKQVSLIHASGLPDHSVSKHLTHPRGRFCTLPLSATGFPVPLGSGLRLSHAGSSTAPGRIEFVILRTGRSPPAALHPASRRRSCSWLQAGERMPEEDFHLSDHSRFQAHVR
jgi:hypothetical protein